MLYNEKTTTSYTRANTVTLRNPHSSVGIAPSLTFHEEHVVTGLNPKGVSLMPSGDNITLEYTEEAMTTPFDLLHPETGEVIGSATLQDLQVILHSLYFHETAKRHVPPESL